MFMSFKEFLANTSPKDDTSEKGAGEIWDNRSNIDIAFGEKGIRSKNVQGKKPNKPVQVKFDPDELYLGHSKRPQQTQTQEKLPIAGTGYGDNYGSHI